MAVPRSGCLIMKATGTQDETDRKQQFFEVEAAEMAMQGKVASEGDDDHRLGDFTRLQIHRPEAEPAGRAHGRLADEHDRQQQQQGETVASKGRIFEVAIVEETQGQGDAEAETEPGELFEVDGGRPGPVSGDAGTG